MRRLALLLVLVGCGGAPRPPSPSPADRLHALGRKAGDASVTELRQALTAADEPTVVAAVEGLWFADAPGTGADVARLVDDPRPAVRLAAVRALGRLATVAEEPAVVRALIQGEPPVRAAAGVAAGVMGRRKVATDALLAPLVEATRHADAAVRAGAVYGLSYLPGNAGAWEELARFTGDPDGDVRALAFGGLGRAGQGEVARLATGLADPSPWVRVEAARALSSPRSSPEMHAALAAWLDNAGEEHAAREGLVRLAPFAREAPVAQTFKRVATQPGPMGCLASAGLIRAGESVTKLDRCSWQRGRLLVDAIKEGGAPAAERLPALVKLAGSIDASERAAAAEALPAYLPDPAVEKLVRQHLGEKEPAVAGSAADALAQLGDKAPAWVVPALVERAASARNDPELHQGFVDALKQLKAEGALPAEPMAGPKADPPVDVGAVTGRHPVLELVTTKGKFHIELDPSLAPWNTAALVQLARARFYDAGSFHRVVPGFVVQGGDPSGTGWGGPGFTLPAEMSNVPYRRGTVGIADAGPGTGGSQFFVMHAPAPHLDGRYTVVGRVPDADMAVVDKLIVGDRIQQVIVHGVP